jgi:hypothetical protein
MQLLTRGGAMNLRIGKFPSRLVMAVALIVTGGATPAVGADNGQAITIVTATFGTIGKRQPLDIGARLQLLCGRGAQSCHVFCSETSFGRYRLGSAPICRVVYRCGAEFVRSVEAMREEPILMRCPDAAVAPLPDPSSPSSYSAN